MNCSELRAQLRDAGLALTLTEAGRLDVAGEPDIIDQYRDLILANRAGLVAALRGPERPGKAPAATPATDPPPRRGKYGPAPVVRPPDPPPPPEPTAAELERAAKEHEAYEVRQRDREARQRDDMNRLNVRERWAGWSPNVQTRQWPTVSAPYRRR